jgi:alpha-mannosidase
VDLNVWNDLFLRIDRIKEKILGNKQYTERFLSQIEFAAKLSLHKGRKNWERLVRKALERSERGIENGENLERITEEAEDILSPIGQEAKKYCLNYIAHAHIDMNWLWGWSDTVNSCYRTFSTMVELMDEFPEFCFSQSQIATYDIARSYSPELFEKIKQKIKGGQWEVIANTWVEADKNMSSGESQLRQLLCAKEYLREVLDLDERER